MRYADFEFGSNVEFKFAQSVKCLIYNTFDGVFDRDAGVICETFFDGVEGFNDAETGDGFNTVTEMLHQSLMRKGSERTEKSNF